MREEVTNYCIRLLPIFLCKAEQDLAPVIPSTGAGCYSIIGPDPSAVLDKKKLYKRTTYKIINNDGESSENIFHKTGTYRERCASMIIEKIELCTFRI
jgi:hypothetical protein